MRFDSELRFMDSQPASASETRMSATTGRRHQNTAFIGTTSVDETGLAHRGADRIVMLRRQRCERQSQIGMDQAELGHRPLDRYRIRLDEQLRMERHEPLVDR